ncbi:LytTR family two component transcriptional regulator [Lutibacter sp. Hel_I_33_5]|uniref:LytR/AlgR family response regulator transcription factor n=1 Tax=Lutibacter sp. Hel_I_33_5 TaxID=1566289 RepID=UPI0011A54FFD|nr:LytTR family DNA-binding domain-containing protein [Lutibacter sp. Hel_I_33_5]TVZ55581.1 LytTR family two component transcriptional regulator [Lutibacter sp. Hel_I_33_5]
MNALLIDDDNLSRAVLRKLCDKLPDVRIIDEFSNAIDALKYLNTNKVDLIFLDIHMPNFSGFDFINTLKNPPNIIFTTSDKDFAIDAFQYECIVDYLLKPIQFDRLEKSIKKAKNKQVQIITEEEKVTEKKETLFVNVDKRLVKINIDDISIIEAKGDYVKIKTKENSYIVHSTLKKVLSKLPEKIFFRVHRSYVINITQIIDIEDNSVLINRDVIPVSRTNKGELLNRLNLL